MKRNPRGKSLTPELIAELMMAIGQGLIPSRAAVLVGVSPQAISNRRRRDPDFRMVILAAEAALEKKLASHVIAWAEKDWRAAMAILERKWPERWSRPEARALAEKEKTAMTAQDVAIWVSMLSAIPERFVPAVPSQKEPEPEAPASPDPSDEPEVEPS